MFRLAPALMPLLFATACGPPTFTEVRDDIFIPSCGLGATCHEGGAGDLDISPGVADTIHGQLVDQPSADAEGETRVIPGDSLNSYLMKKLRGDDDIEGDPMPSQFGLEADRLQVIADWIDAGALND